MHTNIVSDPLAPLKFVFLVQAAFLVAVLALSAFWLVALTWALYHCSKYFPEGGPKTRWILLIVFVPIAGAVAYALAGRPTCNRRFL